MRTFNITFYFTGGTRSVVTGHQSLDVDTVTAAIASVDWWITMSPTDPGEAGMVNLTNVAAIDITEVPPS